MAWQDIVIFASTFFFAYALIPQVIKGFKGKIAFVAIQTSLINSLAMYVLAVTFLTLKLYLSSLMSATTATLWAVMFFQTIKYKH